MTFRAGARTYTVGLDKTGEVGGHIRVLDAGKVLLDKDLTQEIQRQTSLAQTD